MFSAAVFLAAFLLFLVQPIVGKSLLPRFGGAPAVWTACLLVFQTLLLLGYAWAHGLAVRLGSRVQATAHVSLLALGLAFPILPVASGGAPDTLRPPVLQILILALASVGAPFLALAGTSPLLQAWHARLWPARSPYRLYAWSNAGSLLALVVYPLAVEPALALDDQARAWRSALALLVLLVGWCAWHSARGSSPARGSAVASSVASSEPLRASRVGLWIAWAACGVTWFMAITQQLTIDVAAVPFLWMLPLGVYLATLIVTFAGSRGYPRRLATWILPVALALVYVAVHRGPGLGEAGRGLSFIGTVVALNGGLLVACLVCHGELYRLRPHASRTTAFYLAIALGGALGGILVAVVAPATFRLSEELHLAMALIVVLTGVTRLVDGRLRPRAIVAWLGATVALVLLLVYQSALLVRGASFVHRNFFGVLRVIEVRGDRPEAVHRRFYHGSTLHGLQDLTPERRWIPTTYYTPYGGGGAVLTALERSPGRRVGLVGLGVGTLAAYGRPGDLFRFYEIDPDVERVAREWFTYLADSRARCEVVLGDARVRLAAEPARAFDVLVLDAFSGDAVPVHLLTREAFVLYERHLAPNGVIAAHLSNRSLDLTPVVYQLADSLGFTALQFQQLEPPKSGLVTRSSWMVLSRDTEFLERLVAETKPLRDNRRLELFRGDPARYRRIPLWTDRHSDLVRLLR